MFRLTDRDFPKHHRVLGFSQFWMSHSVSLVCHPCLFLMISCMMFNELSKIDKCHGRSAISLCLLNMSKRSTSVLTDLPCLCQNKRALEKILFFKMLEEELFMNTSFCLCWFFLNCSLVPMEWIEIVTQFYGDNSSRIFIFIRHQQHFMYKIQHGVW